MQDGEDITLKKVFDEIVKNRNELKNIIEASETRLILKIESLKKRLSRVEEENLELKNRVENLDRQNRKNNIILFGIKKPSNEVTTEYICAEIKSYLEIDLTENDINDIYPLGRSENRPIKVELLSQMKKSSIIRNGYKLKGRDMSIAHDLTEIQRKEARILRKHLLQARNNREDNCYIRGNKLFINNKSYTANQLETEQEDIFEKQSVSAPATPTLNNYCNANLAEKRFEFPVIEKQVEVFELDGSDKRGPLDSENLENPQTTSSGIANTPRGAITKSSKILGGMTKEKARTRAASQKK